MSPTARSLKLLRETRGYVADVVERRVPFTHTTRDLFGCLDIAALHPSHQGVLGVQTTSGSNLAARRQKVLGVPAAKLWLETGNRIELHGWAKRGPRGKVKRWTARVEAVELADFGVVGGEYVR